MRRRGRKGAATREREGIGEIGFFYCLKLNGYRAPLFIVQEDLDLKQSTPFYERDFIVLGFFHKVFVYSRRKP